MASKSENNMTKRFVDGDIFRKKEFRELPSDMKVAWLYLTTNCSGGGFIPRDVDLMNFFTGLKYTAEEYEAAFPDLLHSLGDEWYLVDYLHYQYKSIGSGNLWTKIKDEYVKRDISLEAAMGKGFRPTVDLSDVSKRHTSNSSSSFNNKRSVVKSIKFVPPTLDEVKEYSHERGKLGKPLINPNDFYEYFDSSGWKDSNGKAVRSWKQKFLTWEAHVKEKKYAFGYGPQS